MSQHVLPTWQTGLSSPSPHSLPSCSGSARPSVRPSVRAAGAPPCPAAAGLGPTQCHGQGGVSRRGRAAAPTVPACPSATTARARPGTGHGPRPRRPAAAPRRERGQADVLLRAAHRSARRLLAPQLTAETCPPPPRPRVGSRGPAEHRRRGVPDCGSPEKALWVAKMSRGGQEPTRGRRVGLGQSGACCSSWVLVSCGSGQRRLPPWPPVSPLS